MKRGDNAINSAFDELQKHFCTKLEGRMLYHYTTLPTFGEFVKDDTQLYCTHYAALNDASEILCGFDVICEHLKSCVGVHEKTCRQLRECFAEGRAAEMIKPTWILSFSLEQDSLYQWGLYVDRKQGGYSIGFNSAELMKIVDESNKVNQKKSVPYLPIRLLPSLYTETDKNVIKEFLDILFKSNDSQVIRFRENGFDNRDATMVILARTVLASCIIKHESFKHENEVRLVFNQVGNSFDNVSLIGGKPRWNLQLFSKGNRPLRAFIKEIWISPNGDKQLLKNVAEMMKCKYGLNYDIKESSSPYNGR